MACAPLEMSKCEKIPNRILLINKPNMIVFTFNNLVRISGYHVDRLQI